MSNYKTANGKPPSKENPCLNLKNGVCIIACHGCCWPYKMTPEDKPASTPNWKHALTEGLDFRKPNEYDAKDRMIIDSEGNCVGIIWEYEGREKANAELIVRAVNCHSRLVEALDLLMNLDPASGEVLKLETYQEYEQLLKEAKGK